MGRQGEVGDRLIDALSDAIAQLHVAGQFDEEPAPFYGGLVSVAAADGLLNAQDELEAMGGTVINRMQRLKENTSLLSPAVGGPVIAPSASILMTGGPPSATHVRDSSPARSATIGRLTSPPT